MNEQAPKRRGRKPLGDEYAGVKPTMLQLPRVMMEAIDLKAQYDRTSKSEVVRNWLWMALRLTASTDRRYFELLKNNAIDISPVNLKPRQEIYADDPTELV